MSLSYTIGVHCNAYVETLNPTVILMPLKPMLSPFVVPSSLLFNGCIVLAFTMGRTYHRYYDMDALSVQLAANPDIFCY